MKILILNGPNLQRLGTREPSVYGTTTMQECLVALAAQYTNVEFDYYQSHVEGHLIEQLYRADEAGFDGVVLNAGAYTHTSIALLDAIRAIAVPVVEVHLSNVHSREPFRHHSMISAACAGVICGFGIDVYRLGVEALLGRMK